MDNNDFSNSRILIVGFGISGIVQTHTFAANGFENLTVVEADESFGGVWNISRHYPGMVANNTKHTFEFPEMRHEPGSFDDFPTQEQTNAYLRKYIAKFDLEKYVHYGTRVQQIQRRYEQSSGKWLFDVAFSKRVNAALEQTFDFVVCATGFTSNPYVPTEYQSPPEGVTVLHSSEIRKAIKKNPGLVQDKSVAVIGTSKSGHDAATWAAGTNAAYVDLIGPTMHWTVPQYFVEDPVKGLKENEMIYTGLMSYLLPCNPAIFKERTRGWFAFSYLVLLFLHGTFLGRTIRDFIWGTKMAELVKKENVPSHLVPKHTFCHHMSARFVAIQNPMFFPYINKGRIRVLLEWPQGFDYKNACLVLQDQNGNSHGKHYDVVICATGWDSSLGFLSDEIKAKLFNKKGQKQLFRNMYSPDLPQLVFLGFHHSTNSMLTYSIGARWIVEMAKGTRGSLHRRSSLADQAYMLRIIDAGLEFDAQGVRNPQGHFTTGMPLHHYVDSLLKDMGSKYYNRAPFLSPMVPAMYEGLMTENL